jgi:hypothetical protein
MELSKEEFYREKLQDEQLEDHKLEITQDFIKKQYDSSQDRHAKKNRDNHAQSLREQGYSVECGRTTSLRGRSVYTLDAFRKIEETRTVQ